VKCKILLSALAAVSIGVLASATKADSLLGTLTLTASGATYSDGNGGEFTASNLVGSGWTSLLATQAAPPQLSSNTFQTFCIEAGINDVGFNSGNTYTAYLVDNATTSVPLKLSNTAAALFGAFTTGHLSGYSLALNSTRIVSAGELQYAIWIAQGDAGAAGGPNGAGTGFNNATTGNYSGVSYNDTFTGSNDIALTQNQYLAAMTYLESLGGYAQLNNAQAVQSYNWYEAALTTYASFIGDTAVMALNSSGQSEGSAQAQLVEVGNGGNVSETPLPRSLTAGLALLSGFAGFQLLQKRGLRTSRIA